MTGRHTGASSLISRIEVENFRGVPNCGISLADPSGKSTSLLLLGDNGSGKSSMLDAIDFALAKRTPRLIEMTRGNQRLHTRYFLAEKNDTSRVSITLADGRKCTADGEAAGVDEFCRVPLVLRRDHLLAFGRSNEEQRGGLLRSWVSTKFLDVDKKSDEELSIKERRSQTQVEMEQLAKELSAELKTSTSSFALSSQGVQIFRTAHRLTARQSRLNKTARNVRRRKAIELGDKLQEAADLHESLSNQLSAARKRRQRQRVAQSLLNASENLNESFIRLAHKSVLKVVKRLELKEVSESGGVALNLSLVDGSSVPAASVLSEATLDLVSLLAILAVIREGVSRGQAKVLVLDDVFQSVDDNMRERIAEYLFDEFSDWQLIIAFHDRMWFERFVDCAKRKNFSHTRQRMWRNQDGQVCVSSGYRTSHDNLKDLVQSGQFNLVPGVAARLLEELMEKLSIALKCQVYRREDDKYDLSALMPGVLERSANFSGLSGALVYLNENKYLRNLVGAHSTSWAEGFSDQESLDFATAVLDVYSRTVCGQCNTVIRLKNSQVSCVCGGLIPA